MNGVTAAGRATSHQRSPSSGENAMATRAMADPPASAMTIAPPKISPSVTLRRVISIALATQTAPSGSPQSEAATVASAYRPRPSGSMSRPVTMTSATRHTSTTARDSTASSPPCAIDRGRPPAILASSCSLPPGGGSTTPIRESMHDVAEAALASTPAEPVLRVLFLTHYFHPEVGAPQSRLLDLANALSRAGHEVTVLTGFPNYPDGVIQPAYRGRLFQVEH